MCKAVYSFLFLSVNCFNDLAKTQLKEFLIILQMFNLFANCTFFKRHASLFIGT